MSGRGKKKALHARKISVWLYTGDVALAEEKGKTRPAKKGRGGGLGPSLLDVFVVVAWDPTLLLSKLK